MTKELRQAIEQASSIVSCEVRTAPRTRRINSSLYSSKSLAQRTRHRCLLESNDIARKLTEAIWHMLTNTQPFAPAPGGSTSRLAA